MNKTTFAAFAAAAVALIGATGCINETIDQKPGTWAQKPLVNPGYTVLNGGKRVVGQVKVDRLHTENNVTDGALIRKAVDEALAQAPGADCIVDYTQEHRTYTKTLSIGPIQIPLESYVQLFIEGIPVKSGELSK